VTPCLLERRQGVFRIRFVRVILLVTLFLRSLEGSTVSAHLTENGGEDVIFEFRIDSGSAGSSADLVKGKGW
jgi:hypothetical protein